MDAGGKVPYPTQSAALTALLARGADIDRYVIVSYPPGFVLVKVTNAQYQANKQARLDMLKNGADAYIEPGFGKRYFRLTITPQDGMPDHYPILNGPHGQWHVRAGVEVILPEAAYSVLLVAVSDIMKTEGQDLIIAGKKSHLPYSINGLASKEEYKAFMDEQQKIRSIEKDRDAILRAHSRPGSVRPPIGGASFLTR